MPLLITPPVESDRIWAVSEEAALTGVKIGMALHPARQIVPAALVVQPDETGYHFRHEAASAALQVRVGGLAAAGLRRPPTAKGVGFLRLDTPEGAGPPAFSIYPASEDTLTTTVR